MYRFALLIVAVTLLTSSIAQAASYQMTSGTIVDPILDTSGSIHDYSGNNLEPGANLPRANLTYANLTDADLCDADLRYANLDDATFSTGTTLYDGQTVAQHGFDAASLGTYLEVSLAAYSANNLTLIPEPASGFLLLTALLLLARVRF